MTEELKVTIDHEEIRSWAQKYHGKPQIMGANKSLMVRINFPGKHDDVFLSESSQPRYINWEYFFQIFDAQGLAFIYEEKDVVDPSLAYHFIKRDNALEDETDSSIAANFFSSL